MILPLPPEELDDTTLDGQIKAIAQTLCNVHHLKADEGYQTLKLGKIIDYYNIVRDKIPLVTKLDDAKKDRFAQWASECLANYKELVEKGLACCEEWVYRHNSVRSVWIENGKLEYRRGATLQFNQLQPVIEWAFDNAPDLPVHYDYDSSNLSVVMSRREVGANTPFPLVMPEKYLFPLLRDEKYFHGKGRLETAVMPEIIESYRNYYRAKLQQEIKLCVKCKNIPIKDKEIMGYCHDDKYPKWTRREKPSYL